MNNPNKIFFIHIPKTGGRSIEAALENIVGVKTCPAYYEHEFLKLESPDGFNLYHGHLMYYHAQTIKPDFKLTILRDPIERAISAYEHIVRDRNHPAHEFLGGNKTFSATLENNKLKRHISNTMCIYLGLRPSLSMFKTPSAAIRHALDNYVDEEILENAKNALLEMDFIGFTEDLDINQLQILKLIGHPPGEGFSTKEINKNPGKSTSTYIEEMPKNLRDEIAHANALDQDLYSFARDIAKQKGWIASPGSPIFIELESLKLSAINRRELALSSLPEIEKITCTFDAPLIGDGWHPKESNGEYSWCFTGPGNIACIYLPKLSGEVEMIRFEVFHAITPAHIEELQVKINGVLLELKRRVGMSLEYNIPELALTHKFTHIEITTPPAIKPASNDNRKIGIAFSSLTIS